MANDVSLAGINTFNIFPKNANLKFRSLKYDSYSTVLKINYIIIKTLNNITDLL